MLIKNKLNQLTTILGLGITLTLIAGIETSTLAQSKDPANQGYQSNEENSFLGGGSNNGFNPLDLIHRANLNNGRSIDEFNQDSETNIKDSASEFKRLQQERLLQQQSQPSSPNSVTNQENLPQ